MRVNTPQISHQTIDGEVVVINLENGCYYSFLEVAAAIWQHADAGWGRREIVEAVAAAYPGTPDAGPLAEAFLEELLADRLLIEGEDDATAGSSSPGFPGPFTPPLVEKFTDMQELLLLDPIHEVDEAGWPHKPSGS